MVEGTNLAVYQFDTFNVSIDWPYTAVDNLMQYVLVSCNKVQRFLSWRESVLYFNGGISLFLQQEYQWHRAISFYRVSYNTIFVIGI